MEIKLGENERMIKEYPYINTIKKMLWNKNEIKQSLILTDRRIISISESRGKSGSTVSRTDVLNEHISKIETSYSSNKRGCTPPVVIGIILILMGLVAVPAGIEYSYYGYPVLLAFVGVYFIIQGIILLAKAKPKSTVRFIIYTKEPEYMAMNGFGSSFNNKKKRNFTRADFALRIKVDSDIAKELNDELACYLLGE